MSAGLLDTLVKLASLGASGVCVLAIFWVGFLISKLPDTAGKEKHKTMRLYMGMTIVIAVIAFASGIANAWFNANAIAKVEQEKDEVKTAKDNITQDFELFRQEHQQLVARYKEEQIRNQEIATNLQDVLEIKEVAALATNAEPRVNDQIKALKKNIERLMEGSHPE